MWGGVTFQVMRLVLFNIHRSFEHCALDRQGEKNGAVFQEQLAKGQEVVVIAHQQRGKLIDLGFLTLFWRHTFGDGRSRP